MGSHSLHQGIFPTQGSNRSLMLQADSLPFEPPGKPLVIQVRLWVWDRYFCIIARHFPSYLGAAFPVSSFFWNAICFDPPPVKILLIFQSSAKRPPFLRSLLKSCKSISHGFPQFLFIGFVTHFPVVMCGCESWTIKKAECQRIDAFELWCW